MAIIRLEDKYKSKYKIQLTPERHYVSSSSGITGSVHVFPNRSITQKDNIDERLNLAPMVEEGTEFSGKPIKSFDSNSLEARREEIFRGEFNKLIGGAFTDAIQYEYEILSGYSGTGANVGDIDVGEQWNDQLEADIAAAAPLLFVPNDTVKRTSDNVVFTYTSNAEWESAPFFYSQLPESDRDRSALKYHVALGMLLDGTHPFTEDHAWRAVAKRRAELYQLYLADNSLTQYSGYSAYSVGNSSYTGESPGNYENYQFTGLGVFTDELDIPYLDSPVTEKADINPWPPEIAASQASIISNWMLSGYSDLSMHPRNATKKEVVLTKTNHDLFSSGSARQRVLANRIDELDCIEAGWWTHNYQCLNLHQYDIGATTYKPFLVYDNTANSYDVDWTSSTTQMMYEFWIKPCEQQIDVGTICQLDNGYALVIIPDPTSEKNGVFEKFKIGFYSDVYAADGVSISLSDVTVPGQRYISSGLLYLDNWHHVVIRFGRNFNNGQFNVYIDGTQLATVIDGVYDPDSDRATGIIDVNTTTVASSLGDYLLVGAWNNTATLEDLWGHYADKQNLKVLSNATVYADGLAVGNASSVQYHLRSELMELRCWSQVQPTKDILANKNKSLTTTDNLLFYIPFTFDPRATTPQWNRPGYLPSQENPKDSEEYYQSPCVYTGGLTINNTNLPYNKTQFCTNSAYIVGMPFVNVHSHLRECVNGNYPVIAQYKDMTDLTDLDLYPVIEGSEPRFPVSSTNQFTGLKYFQDNWPSFTWLRSINSLVLPCDNTFFTPGYELFESNGHNFLQKDYLSLHGEGIGSTLDKYEIKHFYDDEVFAIQGTIVASDPSQSTFKGKVENYQTATLVAENKLEANDYCSPISTVLSVPQIYYGNRIHPGSISLSYTTVSGKTITIIDREGTLYRKNDKSYGYSTKVGHVDYGSGIICVFSPLVTGLGIDDFDLKLRGEKNLHVMQVDIPCDAGVANVSDHPSYKKLKATANSSETDGNVTYISTIYLHDENLNIIGKVNLAQPVQKREEDSFIFRVKLDF